MRIHIKKDDNIFDEFLKRNINISAYCGGKGKCGKCRIRVAEGSLPAVMAEKNCLTDKELREGIRLACCHRICEADVVIEAEDESQNFEILGLQKKCYETDHTQEGSGIAVDIGTTTIVIAQLDLSDGHLIKETKIMNPQRKFGADVISRIQACNEYGVSVLQSLLLREIEKVLLPVGENIKRMFVCGNSTMEHIFLGINPRKISEYPYTCEFENIRTIDSKELFPDGHSFPVVVFPNISAFVGGDITAGIISTELYRHEKSMLIDLGTNGEIALSHKGVIYTTSTAAGPAFEGGNMVCGVASIPGAVCHVSMKDGNVFYGTIGDKKPIGICGSGYIEGISEILSNHLMDETGYMEKDVVIQDEIRIVPADIRNFQLAKSAIRSGIDILCRRAGLDFASVERVYISGGFGKASNLKCLANLKLIPAEFLGKTSLLGNTALDGTVRTLLMNDCTLPEKVKAMSLNVDLASDEKFNDEFMENMWF